MVAGLWHDSLKLKHACFTARFACAATHAMQFVQHAAESVATRVYGPRTSSARAHDVQHLLLTIQALALTAPSDHPTTRVVQLLGIKTPTKAVSN